MVQKPVCLRFVALITQFVIGVHDLWRVI